MLVYEIRSIERYNFDNDTLSEIIESNNNKNAYKAACSIAREYANKYDCFASVVAHDATNYNATAFICFYASPTVKTFASANHDAMGFYMSDWRNGY